MNTKLSITLSLFLASHCCAQVSPKAPRPEVPQRRIDEVREFSELSLPPAERAAFGQTLVASGRQLLASEPDRAMDLFNQGGQVCMRNDAFDAARLIYEEMAQSATAPKWALYANTQMARACVRLGMTNQAEAACDAAIASFENRGSPTQEWGYFAGACDLRADLYRRVQDITGAVRTRTKLITTLPEHASQSDVERAFKSVARDRFAGGDVDGGRQAISDLFTRVPDYGSNDGRAITLKLEAVDAGRGMRNCDDDQYMPLLEGLWAAQTTQASPELLMVANHLTTAYARRHREEEQYQILGAACRQFDALGDGWRANRSQSSHNIINELAGSMFAELAIAADRRHDGTTAYWAADIAMTRYPQPNLTENLAGVLEANRPR